MHRLSLNKKLYYETKSTTKENQLWSALYISFLAPSVWNNLQNELKCCTNWTHLRQNFLYSEDVNKSPSWSFDLPDLNVFLIYQYHYLPKKKIYWAKKQGFDDVSFAMTLFWAKKSQKLSLLGEEKNPKPKNCLKNFSIM